MPEGMFERSRRATENLKESLPIFLALAILSLSDIDATAANISLSLSDIDATAANISIALSWLSLRVIFAAIYISGFNLKPANASGQRAQPLRSLVWTLSIVCLFMMGAYLI